MASLRPALESYGIVLPEPNARRLLAALDTQEGWSGARAATSTANARRPIPTPAGGSASSAPLPAASCQTAGPATRARLRALLRICARHFGGPGQWAAIEDPETGDAKETVILSPTTAHPPRETALHPLDLLQPLLESHDVRAFQRDGLQLVDRLAWKAPADAAHQRIGDLEILTPFRLETGNRTHRYRNGLRLRLSANAERNTLDLLLPAPTLRLACPSGSPPVPDALPGPYGLPGPLPPPAPRRRRLACPRPGRRTRAVRAPALARRRDRPCPRGPSGGRCRDRTPPSRRPALPAALSNPISLSTPL